MALQRPLYRSRAAVAALDRLLFSAPAGRCKVENRQSLPRRVAELTGQDGGDRTLQRELQSRPLHNNAVSPSTSPACGALSKPTSSSDSFGFDGGFVMRLIRSVSVTSSARSPLGCRVFGSGLQPLTTTATTSPHGEVPPLKVSIESLKDTSIDETEGESSGGGPVPSGEEHADNEDEPVIPPEQLAVRRQEIGGPTGPEPTRYGDWERGGRCSDF
ncbi:hypothetical protein CBR_g41366 [Chara braunii]|uniref:Succinate dehydrogenase assembly factor 4, mitochondrial n=1 Tax=Chara braunii TaxID=69332 RepID=A0A388LVT4_CHABU|nr:hypothetical protein CBR_g41366 [Chara braunii]|eukprot:GBG86371.1 hypothetical protein CBR_g41366 [Chara braunii]